jgi:hypothetical protein
MLRSLGVWRPNNAIHLTVNSRLRHLLPAGDRER